MQHSISSQISASLFLYFISFLFIGFPTFLVLPLSLTIRR